MEYAGNSLNNKKRRSKKDLKHGWSLVSLLTWKIKEKVSEDTSLFTHHLLRNMKKISESHVSLHRDMKGKVSESHTSYLHSNMKGKISESHEFLGSSGGVVNSFDFCPALLKSFGCFYFSAYFLHNGRW